MPTTAGWNLDVTVLAGDEGPFIGMLKRAGCVVLGKTKTVVPEPRRLLHRGACPRA